MTPPGNRPPKNAPPLAVAPPGRALQHALPLVAPIHGLPQACESLDPRVVSAVARDQPFNGSVKLALGVVLEQSRVDGDRPRVFREDVLGALEGGR